MSLHKLAAITAALLAVSSALQPGAAPAQSAPLRDLEFGDINFVHTTDVHGWHAGHLLESSFSADWGDYISFTEHLRTKLEAEGRDLLVIDTGDRIEGNGLYDSSVPRGKYTFGIFEQQHVDLLCSGNHELYKNSSAEDDFLELVPAYRDNYLASNLCIIDPETGILKPLAPTHRKFTTKNGVRTMAFGFIFDFTRNDKNTVVTPVEVAIKQDWFQTAIRESDIDLFVIIGHVALRQIEFELIYREIRNVNSNATMQFFGGHFHTRDYRIFDNKAHALASGRFMETIGFQSISNLDSIDNVTFTHRYIDNNLYSLAHHANTSASAFSTSLGIHTTNKIAHARAVLNLDQTFGCAPQTYWMSRAPYPDKASIFSLLTDEIFPTIINPTRRNRTRMMLTNTGAIRFDIFAGPFTRDSTYIVSPFTSNLSYIPDVPYRLAKKLLPILNGGVPQIQEAWEVLGFSQRDKLRFEELQPPEQRGRKSAAHLRPATTMEQTQTSLQLNAHLTPGYTTHDDLGADGDDTIHSPIDFYDVPNCIQAVFSPSTPPSSTDFVFDDTPIDLIFNEFLTPYILRLLNFLPYLDDVYAGTLYSNAEYVRNLEWRAVSHDGCKGDEMPNCSQRGLCVERDVPRDATWMKEVVSISERVDAGIDGGENKVEQKLERPTWREEDVQNYAPGETFTSLLARWVSENWAGNCGEDVAVEQYEL